MPRPKGTTGIPRQIPVDVQELRAFGLFTAAEVCRAMGIELTTILARIRRGEVPGYLRPGQRDRYKYFVDLPEMLRTPGVVIEGTDSHRLLSEMLKACPKPIKPVPRLFVRASIAGG